MTTLYTLKEVSERNGDGKNGIPVWVVIRDIVYDFTPYLDDVSDLNTTHNPVNS